MSTAKQNTKTEWEIWWDHLTDGKRRRVNVWLRGNPPPANWNSTQRAWAFTDMPGWWLA